MRLRGILFLIGLLLFPGSVAAAPFEMDVLETEDLRLLYLDPFQTYLSPHVVRNFHNSYDFQKRLYGWAPQEKSTVILTDLTDYGNAGAAASPRNGVSVFVAPASRTLETMPSSERIFMLMNHELVHVANMDMAAGPDLKWRRFFGGKPRQTSEHPETILYNYLATPRMAVPRWYLEGAAVFMETWMSGGLGRAQGGWISRLASTPIFTAPDSFPTWRWNTRRRKLLNGCSAVRVANAIMQNSLKKYSVSRWRTHGMTG
jgi:hypothetical protein